MLFPIRYAVFVLLPVQLLCTAALLRYDPSSPVDRVRLMDDCTHIINAIPEVEFRPERQRVDGRLTLTIPKNAYRYRLPARFIHGICEVKVKMIQNESPFGYVAVTVEELQLHLWGIAKQGLEILRDACVSRGLGGIITLELPGRLFVLKMQALKVDTYNNL